MTGQGVSKETCDLVAQKLVATNAEIATMPKNILQKLYEQFLGVPAKSGGLGSIKVYNVKSLDE